MEQGYQLTDLEPLEQEGAPLWDGVFTRGVPRTRLWRNFEMEAFLEKIRDERADEFRLVDVETYLGSRGQRLWAGVFREEASRYELELGLNTDEFHDVWERRSADGFRLVDVETYEATNGLRLWAGVFVEGHGGYGLYRNVTTDDFRARRNDLRRDGLRIVDVEAYRSSRGQRLWALVARAGTHNEQVRTEKPFCGTWAGPLTGFWETHQDALRQGRTLADFERYPD